MNGPVSRRRVLSGLTALPALLLAGCGEEAPIGSNPPARLFIATGNTTGVYYQLGGGFADIITRQLPGYEATAEPTGASIDNIYRVARADADIGFTLADAAADAVAGTGQFDRNPQPIQALARIYSNYMHLIVRADLEVEELTDLEDLRVSTGGPASGTEMIALRLLTAAGLDPDRDIERVPLSLPATVDAMRRRSLDAMFFSGGLPTGGISDLLASMAGRLSFLPLNEFVAPLREQYGEVYSDAVIPARTYGLTADVPTISVSNLLVVRRTMHADLAYDLTRLLFTHTDDLAVVHPEGRNILVENGPITGPVPLHPGASRFFDEQQ